MPAAKTTKAKAKAAAKKKVPTAKKKAPAAKKAVAKKKAATKKTAAKKTPTVKVKAKTNGSKKRIAFSIRADKGSKVYLAGTFNNWSPTKKPLKEKDGLFSGALMLTAGRHEYKFIVNDVWCVDPECDEWVANDLGSLNSVVAIS